MRVEYYHIIMRGINQQSIFEDEEDRVRFIETLQEYKEICEYKLYTYCLMGNHLLCLEISEKRQVTDGDARIIIEKLCKVKQAIDVQKLEKQKRDKYIKDLKEGYNLSIRQSERLYGVNRVIIRKLEFE